MQRIGQWLFTWGTGGTDRQDDLDERVDAVIERVNAVVARSEKLSYPQPDRWGHGPRD